MSRPDRRMSSLTGTNPVVPPATPPADPDTSNPGRGKAAKQPGKKYPSKVSFYQETPDTDRIRGAIPDTMVSGGNRNLSQFMNRVSMAEVKRLEDKYNGGKPFPAVKAGDLPPGCRSTRPGRELRL